MSLFSPIDGPVPGRAPKQDMMALRLLYDRAVRDMAATRKWAETATTCVNFVEGDQWDPKDKAILEAEGRIGLTINKISPLVRLVIGYQQQNRYDIRYLPGSDALATDDIATVLSHTAKQITTSNGFKWLESDVFRDGIQAGRGYFDWRLSFQKNDLGEIKCEVLDPFSVYPDCEAGHYEPEKWGHVTVARWMSLDEIELMFGPRIEKMLEPYSGGVSSLPFPIQGAIEDDIRPPTFFGLAKFFDGVGGGIPMGTLQFGLTDFLDRSRKMIRVLDQQAYRLTRSKYVVDLDTGDTREVPEDTPQDALLRMLAWARSGTDSQGNPKQVHNVVVRAKLERRVRWTIVAGDIIVYDQWSPYRTFTVVPFFPYFRRGKTMGMVEDLLDPQREINKRRSAELHIINTTANSGWVYEENSLDSDNEELLQDYGATPGIHIKYRKGAQKPEKIQPSAPPMGMEKLEQKATADLKEISGINESALGNIDRVQSGRAIEARQRQAVIAIQTYIDSMSRTRELNGMKILELVQDHYTEQRLVRVQGDDGQQIDAVINQQAAGEIINDVTVGTYQVAIDESPMSATFMAGQLDEALSMKEQGIAVPDDIMVDLSSLPRKREIKQRMAEKAKAGPPPPDPTKVAVAHIQAAGQVAAAEVKADAQLGAAAYQTEVGAATQEGAYPQGAGGDSSPTAGPQPGAPGPAPAGPGAPSPAPRPGGGIGNMPPPMMKPHAVVPGGGVRPQGHGFAPELPPFGAG